MEYYNIYLPTETQKYDFIAIAREAGAVLASVSGCGTGYYISIQATPDQVEKINCIFGGAA